MSALHGSPPSKIEVERAQAEFELRALSVEPIQVLACQKILKACFEPELLQKQLRAFLKFRLIKHRAWGYLLRTEDLARAFELEPWLIASLHQVELLSSISNNSSAVFFCIQPPHLRFVLWEKIAAAQEAHFSRFAETQPVKCFVKKKIRWNIWNLFGRNNWRQFDLKQHSWTLIWCCYVIVGICKLIYMQNTSIFISPFTMKRLLSYFYDFATQV